MGRDDPFQTRYTGLDVRNSGSRQEAAINRNQMMIVTDFYAQMILSGFGFHVQAGTENAGAAATDTIDDQLAFTLIDQNAGYAMLPVLYQITPGVVANSTVILQAMLEADKEKKRYTSGGTAFVPENMSGGDQAAFAGVAYAGGDVISLAKSAVPDSMELARKDYIENSLNTKIGYPGMWDATIYSAYERPACVLLDDASLIGHLGSTTALATGYAAMQIIQFPKKYIKA